MNESGEERPPALGIHWNEIRQAAMTQGSRGVFVSPYDSVRAGVDAALDLLDGRVVSINVANSMLAEERDKRQQLQLSEIVIKER